MIASLLRSSAALLATLILVCPAPAQESWVGETVMLRKPNLKLSEVGPDGKSSDVDMRWTIYRVLEDKKGRLLIHAAGQQGSVDKVDMLLLRDGVEYYSTLIRQNAKNEWAWDQRGALTVCPATWTSPSRTMANTSACSRTPRPATSTAASSGMRKRRPTRPLPTSTWCSPSMPKMSMPTMAAAISSPNRRNSTWPWRITTRSSPSSPGMSMHSTAAAMSGAIRSSTTRPWRTIPRRSVSIRSLPILSMAGAICGCAGEEGLRQGHRGLQRSHPARSEVRRSLQRPRQCLERSEKTRQGHRGLQ